MNNIFNSNENIFIAGSNGMVGSAIKKALLKIKNQYKLNFNLLTPSKSEVDLCKFEELKKFFDNTKPSIVINAAGKVGGIYANSSKPFDFIFDNLSFAFLVSANLSFLNLATMYSGVFALVDKTACNIHLYIASSIHIFVLLGLFFIK